MKIENQIAQAVTAALKALYGIEAAPETLGIQKTKKEFEGNLTLVVFPFLKASHKAPEATAAEIGEYLKGHNPELISAFNVVKGFLNLVVSPSCWVGQLNAIAATPHYGIREVSADSPLVMIEYSSPNTNKPLHLGHVRNNLLGTVLPALWLPTVTA